MYPKGFSVQGSGAAGSELCEMKGNTTMTTEQKNQKRNQLFWHLEETRKQVRYYAALLRDMSLRFDEDGSCGRLLMSDLCDTVKSGIEKMEQWQQELDRLG